MFGDQSEMNRDRNDRATRLRAEMIDTALEIKAFLQHKGRRPYRRELAYDKLAYYEKRWDQDHLLPHEVVDLIQFAATLPTPRQEKHGRRLAEYRHFIAENHRLPSSSRSSAGEKSLAQWARKMKESGFFRNPDVAETLSTLIDDFTEQASFESD